MIFKDILSLKSKLSLDEVKQTSPVLSEILESTKLITGNIFTLFSNEKMLTLTTKTISCESIVNKIKKDIKRKSVQLDASGVLEIIEKLTDQQSQQIGTQFFYITARKFSKQQSIETYAEFFKQMNLKFGFDQNFLKQYLTMDRDFSEALTFLSYVKNWKIENIDADQIAHKSFIYFVEKFAKGKKLEDVINLLKESDKYLLTKDKQEVLQNLFLKISQIFIQYDSTCQEFQQLLKVFQEINLEFNCFLQNKILDFINKSQKDQRFMDTVIHFFQEQNINKDLYTYNILIDYNCSQEQLEKAMQIFQSISQNGLEPDTFSYSIMIKGLKNSNNTDISKGLKLFKEYHQKNKIKDTIIYNSLLDLLISTDNVEKADVIFKKMEEDPDIYPDEITFNTIIKGCCKVKDLDTAMKYFNKIKNYNLQPNRITYNSLMDLAVKIEKMNIALKLVEQMQQEDIAPDSFTYSIILNGLKLNKSSQKLVQICLSNIKKVILSEEIKSDYILFNSILDVAEIYELIDEVKYFHELMNKRGIKDTSTVCQILIRSYTKAGRYDEAIAVFENMLNTGMFIKEVTYGLILGTCSVSGKMNFAMKIFESLKTHDFNMNSIVFTTILKGFIKTGAYKEALQFFDQVKQYTDLPGIIITYNCALDVYSHQVDVQNSLQLFAEIDKLFGADMVSYSTIIKTLCAGNQKELSLEYVKKMIKSKIKIDISVINLYLENCSTPQDFKLAIDAYKFAMMQNLTPNQVTFGIMIKIYGFARELHKAFDLLDLMNVYQIKPSIIIFTNLIHISFYNRNPRKAELAFTMFRKNKLQGDPLLYSKIIEGLIRFNRVNKVHKYIDYAIKEKCHLKQSAYQAIKKKFNDEETEKKIKILKSFSNVKRGPHKNVKKHVNDFNIENPKKYKKMIREARQQNYKQTGKRNGINSQKQNNDYYNNSNKKYYNKDSGFNNQQNVALFNFRRNKAE